MPKLGGKSFEQCAGFLRIKDGTNLLDDTIIHPESYKLAKTIKMNLDAGLDKTKILELHKS